MRVLKPNDQVLVLLPTTHNKLLAKWQGPYKVIRRMGKVTYKIDIPGARSRKKVYHINLLKKWYSNEAQETACMVHVHVDNSKSGTGEELDDVPSWREDDGCKCVIGKLCAGQKEQLEGLLRKYQEVFKNKPGKTKAIKHFIHTINSKPVKQHPYQLPHAYWEEVKQE